MDHLGTQWTAELYGCDPAVLDDTDRVAALMLEAARVAQATIVGSRFHRFSPHGVSGVVIIAESHIAIHTWPEHGYAALDVFTCGETLLTEAAFQFLATALHATRVDAVRQERGSPARIAAYREPAPPTLPREPAAPPLFSPAWCARFVAECEAVARWRPASEGEVLSLDHLPGVRGALERLVADALARGR